MTRIISIVGGMQPSAPTIGTATAGDTTASVAFTASSYIGKGTITYTATSSPGGLTATGASSPLTVTGLSNGTAYTFTVVGNTNYGVASVASAASNSITPAASGSYESIATVSVGSGGSTSVVFSSIPQTFAHLQLRYISRDARTGSGDSPVDLTFNGSSASNYSKQFVQGASSTVSAGAETGSTYLRLEGGGNQSLSDSFGAGVADILDYTSTTKNKTVYQFAGVDKNGSGFVRILGGSWYASPAAITSITLTPFSSPFAQYSHFALYGIKGS